ncbi:hypothetical protein OIE13_22200 [Streptosporangium sp. NBC_01810]|uniref:hypothetical protein n=1 Tax=Streptosporangium sp. NBC_01810 TaxID=2975951 RepID=UPI002DDACF7F|nr:hypothetical protein [Streptosporangium sp. NBC_01810]WSA23655.1 hypothetical protein OIE13_22200 [Streptosporangium sp. NBC_01810]
MDTELSAAISALPRLDRDAALARLALAAGGTREDAAAILNPSTLATTGHLAPQM